MQNFNKLLLGLHLFSFFNNKEANFIISFYIKIDKKCFSALMIKHLSNSKIIMAEKLNDKLTVKKQIRALHNMGPINKNTEKN